MPDLSNAEISVEGEYGECLVCGESFHWEHLTNTAEGSYCDDHVNGDDKADMGQHTKPLIAGDIVDGVATYNPIKKVAVTDDEADMGHDTALERDTFGDAR